MDTEGESQEKAEDSSDASTNQATPGISRKPPELGAESLPLQVSEASWLGQQLDFRLVDSRAVRK